MAVTPDADGRYEALKGAPRLLSSRGTIKKPPVTPICARAEAADFQLQSGLDHGALDLLSATEPEHVTTSWGQDYVVEGYWAADGLLQAWRDAHGLPNDNKTGDYSAGKISGPFACDWLPILDWAVDRINKSHVTYSLTGPNSNTALFYMLSILPPTVPPWFKSPNLVGYYEYNFTGSNP